MSRQQFLQVEELVRTEESRFLERIGELSADRQAERDTNTEIEDGITRMRESVQEIYPDFDEHELNRLLRETRLTLRRKAGLEPLTSEEIAMNIARKESSKKRKQVIFCIIILILCLTAILGIIKYAPRTNSAENNQNTSESAGISIKVESYHPMNKPDQAIINVFCSTDADEVILYRNTNILQRWNKGGNYSVTDYHDRGTYVYFAEAFRHGIKTTSDQSQIVFGPKTQEVQQQ